MKLTGNKGEWSEFYAFVKLLSTGKLYAADEHLKKLDETYFPILKILRHEDEGVDMEYVILSEDGQVEVHWHTETVRTLQQQQLARISAYIYNAIVNGGSRAFEIVKSDEIMQMMACSKISAPSTDKTDITMQLHDIHTGYDPVCGFSIKSELGSPPTLLNASGATNFVFEVNGVTDDEMDEINSIDTSTKIIDRIEKIKSLGSMKYSHMKNSTFSGNLLMIDTYMEEMLAQMLQDYYENMAQDCKSLVKISENRNALGYPRKGIYEYKMKKFLCSIALGMMPAKSWDGHDEANGGYVIVKDDGEVVAFHIYNRDAFETYLLNNTKFERGSTKKHGFASLYKENGKMYINLNLQIRFV